MYVSSSSYMYLRIPYYCDACLKSSALRVGVKTLHNTQYNIFWISTVQWRLTTEPGFHQACSQVLWFEGENAHLNGKIFVFIMCF